MKKQRLHILRTPESQGRPERYVFDPLGRHFLSHGFTVRNWHCYDFARELAPDNGSAFYHVGQTCQMIQVAVDMANMLEQGDIVLVCDAQAPVVGIIRYITALRGITVRIAGWFHSSVHQPGDMLEHDLHSQNQERATLTQLDIAFAATDNLRTNLCKAGADISAKVFTTYGLPLDHVIEWRDSNRVAPHRANRVVWPHRYAEDKDTDLLHRIAASMPDTEFVVLTPVDLALDKQAPPNLQVQVCRTKQHYYQELASAKVVLSTAKLETFGYAVIEGVVLGCAPVLPDRACYPEMYHPRDLYNHEDPELSEVRSMIEAAFDPEFNLTPTGYHVEGQELARLLAPLLRGPVCA